MTIRRITAIFLAGAVLVTIALARPFPQSISKGKGPANPTDGRLLLVSAESRPLAVSQDSQSQLKEIRRPDVIFVPTPQDVVEIMLELAKVTKDDLVYDLGCGDGRIVVTAAKKYGARCVGYDIDPQRVRESLENVRKNKVENLVRIEQEDIFTLDLSKANVITLYLLRSLNTKLLPQLEKLKPGSRVVSHDFDIIGVVPDTAFSVYSKEDDYEHEVYLWTIPFKKVGESEEDY